MRGLVLAGALSLAGCVGPSSGVHSVVATAANAILPELTHEYDQEQRSCVSTHPGDKEGAIKCVADVRAPWKPVWESWDALRAASDGDAIGAWCKFLDALKAAKINMPVPVAGVTCG